MSESQESSRSIKREHWRKHIDNWQSSGISQTKYCEQENISFASFSWWRTKGLKGKPNAKKISFVPAVIKEPAMVVSKLHGNIELIFPNQTKLVLPPHLSMNSIVAIIKSLVGLS